MREGEDHIQTQAEIYAHRRNVMLEGINRLGWEAESPRATMFVWAKVKDEHLQRYGGTTEDFTLAMVDEAEVAMTPGAAFGDLGEGYVRMALVENEQRIRQAFRQLDRVLNKSSVPSS
ncbi:MAG: aminotransferase class I/II-fold pyridoxal phosphate-dependent enzyme, partial [Phycisphaeraceae bacterium]|nr:aminotransferase class I/II-fold pyridoxal phosphate-dependent enzyme [Phycisphaeraceae bacterium]